MPRLVTELAQGQEFSRSAEEGGVSDSAQRVFRVVLTSPNEVFSPQAACGVYVGSQHPYNLNLVCFDFAARFDGDSRLVSLVTFRYRNFNSTAASQGREEQRTKSPEIRLATWTTDTSLYETPALAWRQWWSSADDANKWVATKNPAGETYEGVTMLQPVVTFRIEQLSILDPSGNMTYVGFINSTAIKMGALTCNPHTLMFRGMSVTPHQESFGPGVWKGYKAVYELNFRRNLIRLPTSFADRDGPQANYELGWDRPQVVEGTKILNSGLNTAGVDNKALNLKHTNFQVNNSALTYADGTQDTWVRAMVTIPSMEGGYTQRPASSPVAMNNDGTPRDLTSLVSGKYLSPIVVRYQTQPDIDFKTQFGLRLPE